MKKILLISHIKVQNANSISSPYTNGFPALTAFFGFIHALSRAVKKFNFKNLEFKSAAIICHDFKLHIYKTDFVYSIVSKAHPLKLNGKNAAFIEEGRCNLTVSLAIEYTGVDKIEEEYFLELIETSMRSTMKLAGGDILDFNSPELLKIADEKDLQQFKNKIMPGYAIIERRNLIIDAMNSGQDPMDAILDYLKIRHSCEVNGEKVKWISKRKIQGWIVPIATGFQAISPLNFAKNQRDPNYLHCFAESVITLGEFIMPHRVKRLEDLLWHTKIDIENGLYLCVNNQIT
jgi:CRISPR-associated protein Csy2